MKMNRGILKRGFCLAISSIMVLCSTSIITVSAETNSLSKYDAVIEHFNKEHGTAYQIANEKQLERVNSDEQERNDFLFSMSENEFYDYLEDITDAATVDETSNNVNNNDYNNEPIRVSPINKTQRYYYTGNYDRYLYLNSTYIYVDGYNRYNSVTGFGSYHSAYPAIVPTSYSAQITNYSTEVYVSFQYDRYIAQYIIDTAVHYGSYTFNVNNGDTFGYTGGWA